jgi:hypothetical protein
MKAFATAALLLFSASAIADEASDARIAELEARIKTLEAQVQRLTSLLDVATRPRTATAVPRGEVPRSEVPSVEGSGGDEAQASASPRAPARVDAPPLLVVTPQETIRDEIRFQCMQRQTYEHAIGGAAPNYSSC